MLGVELVAVGCIGLCIEGAQIVKLACVEARCLEGFLSKAVLVRIEIGLAFHIIAGDTVGKNLGIESVLIRVANVICVTFKNELTSELAAEVLFVFSLFTGHIHCLNTELTVTNDVRRASCPVFVSLFVTGNDIFTRGCKVDICNLFSEKVVIIFLLKGYFKKSIVNCRKAEVVDSADTGLNVSCALDAEEEGSIGTVHFGRKNSSPSINNVIGGDVSVIAPLGFLKLEIHLVKLINFIVIIIPFGSEAGLNVAILVDGGERFEDQRKDLFNVAVELNHCGVESVGIIGEIDANVRAFFFFGKAVAACEHAYAHKKTEHERNDFFHIDLRT